MVSAVFSISLDSHTAAFPTSLRNGTTASLNLREFIGGEENRLVPVAAESVLDKTVRYNPIVFFGPSGTGKTLLARGLASRWKRAHRGSKLLATSGIDFAREYADAVDTDSVADLRGKYRRASLLLIDDVDQLESRTAAQHELRETLDILLRRGKQMLITMKHAPAETTSLVPGLASRLAAGLAVPLVPPGPSSRRRILQRLSEVHAITIPDNVIELIVNGVPDDPSPPVTVPQLNTTVMRLGYSVQEDGETIDEQLARRCLLARDVIQQPTLSAITQRVSRVFSLKVAEVRGPKRMQRIVRARGVAMLLARRLTNLSLEQIGRYFGNRDHSTVMHACRKTEATAATDPFVARTIDELMRHFEVSV